MPDYRSIKICLHSQFDVEPLPEYKPHEQQYFIEQVILEAKVARYVDDNTSTCSVYVPVTPGSQFWVTYVVSPPVPLDQHFLFKLFINGTHVFNWSTCKEQKWRGKTMFGLYERQEEDGRKTVEKRVLCFTTPGKTAGRCKDMSKIFDEDAYVEIRVHRAHGRKRLPRELGQYADSEHAKHGHGVSLVNAGRAGPEFPKRFYKFALIDPIDQPFAQFRFYYRTWEQVKYLGVLEAKSDTPTDGCNMPVIEPAEYEQEDEGGGGVHGAAASRRSSAPRRLSRPLPSVPQTKDGPVNTSYQPHPAYPMEDWNIRTPSPVQSLRGDISTPPPGVRRGLMATSLLNVVTSVWKRRGTPSSAFPSEAV